MTATKRAVGLLALVVAIGVATLLRAQEVAMSSIKYNSGQSIQPSYEGWLKNPDGSFSLWFGYLNRNYQETPDIAPGPDNGFGEAGEDLGQPTHFLPRRQYWVFKVTVPADWPKDKDVVWTVNANGVPLKAYGSLWPVWEVDERIISAANGGRVQRNFDEPLNHGPKIVSMAPTATVEAGAPLTLTVSATDDGMPTREMIQGSSDVRRGNDSPFRTGGPDAEAERLTFRVKWVEYRAPAGGTVKFTPTVSPVVAADGKLTWTDGKATTRAVFSKPGRYVVRAYVLDADAFFVTGDVTVTVR